MSKENVIVTEIATLNFFQKYNKGTTEFDWLMNCLPYDPYLFVERHIVRYGEMPRTARLKLVVLDEEFEKKYKLLQFRNPRKLTEKYGRELPDEDCMRLLRKHNLINTYRINFLPMAIFLNGEHTIPDKISDHTRELLQQFYEVIFGPENVLVGNRLIAPSEYARALGSVYKEMIKEMSTGFSTESNVEEVQRINEPFFILYLPILIRGKLDSPYIDFEPIAEELEKEIIDVCRFAGAVAIDEAYSEKVGSETVLKLDESEAWKSLIKDIGHDVQSLENRVVPDYFVPEFHPYALNVAEEKLRNSNRTYK